MKRSTVFLICCLTLAAASGAFAAEDERVRITTLEQAVTAGTANRADKLELVRAYVEVGRFYEARKLAESLVASDASDREAAELRDKAAGQLRLAVEQRVADAEAAAARRDASDADRLELANAYFAAGHYARAAETYEALPAAIVTRDVRLHHARALSWAGRQHDAERMYAAILAEASTPELELEYGRLLSWMGASQASIERLTRLYASNPSEDVVVALANARAWSHDRDGAVRLLTDYTTSNRSATKASALLEELRTSPDIQLERLSRRIESEPYNLSLRVQRAHLYNDAGRHGDVIREVEFIRENGNDVEPALIAMADAARARQKEQSADLDARYAAVDLNDSTQSPRMLELARAYTGISEYAKAIRLYEAYLRHSPDDDKARLAYARVLSWDRRYPAAQRQYQALLDKDPTRADLKLEYAQVLSYDRRYVPAVRTLRSLTDLSEHDGSYLYADVPTRAHFNLGQIYRWYGWSDHAVREQNRALTLDSDFFPAQRELARARDGRPASQLEARQTFERNSNDFEMRRTDLVGEHWINARTEVQASVGRHFFDQNGTGYDANAVGLGARYRQTDVLSYRANIGATFWEEGLGTRPVFGAGAVWLPNIQSRVAVDYNHYDLVYDVSTLRSLVGPGADPLSIDDLRAHYDYDSGGLWSFLGDVSAGRISDDNSRLAAHGLLSFRLWSAPFVAVKADGRWLGYDERSPRYWSPSDYNSLAAVLQVGQDIREKLYWTAEAKVGRSWEGDRSSDLRAYAARLTVPVGDTFDLIGSFSYGRSGRFESFLDQNTDFVNYWQRSWYVGIRLKRAFASDDARARNRYYYDDSDVFSGSTVIPPEVH